MGKLYPPFEIKNEMFELSMEIMKNLGKLSNVNKLEKLPRPRKISRFEKY